MTLKSNGNSRRSFLAGSASAVGGLAAANLYGQTTTPAPTDLDVLNYALRLERLEAAFYAQGLARLAATDFAKAQFAAGFSTGQMNALYTNLQAIRDHEQTHVMQITAAITQLGGTPAAPDAYVFGPNGTDTTTFASPDTFIMVARTLENTGVSAYDGAIRFVSSPDLRQAAATIATVEARHAAYLNELNGQSPFPASTDPPLSMQDVLTAVQGFLTNSLGGGPQPPTISIASRAISTATKTITLDASGSTAANGGPLRYIWENTLGGPYVTFSDPNSPTPTVTFIGGRGVYSLLLSIIDQTGFVSSIVVKINYTGS